MSTTFKVYSPTKILPFFNDVLSLCNKYLRESLEKHNVNKSFIIDVRIQKSETHDVVSFDKTNPVIWSDDEYAWFTIMGQPGGCDAYYRMIDDLDIDCWNGEFIYNERAKKIEPQMRKCLDTGFYWYFRRSAGQPAIINLSYGLIAAAFAELTNGFIFSDDGAWDYAMFPATAHYFLQDYFNPQYPNPEHADWAKKCIDNY